MALPSSAFPPAPPTASTCAKCGTSAQPATAALSLVLRYGALMDSSVTPLREEGGKELETKAAGLMVAEQTIVTADSIGSGTLDPIVGRFTLNVAQVVTLIIITLPMGLISLFVTGVPLSKGEERAMNCTLRSSAYQAFMTRLRVAGFKDRALAISVGGWRAKQREFAGALFRRAGLQPMEFT